ncbi:MAG TPA: hypothetical protein VMW66_03385, partial [Elusimicrobiales bacterium]|nr:hypothetical protein [Elusimicrobiales bacterium]
ANLTIGGQESVILRTGVFFTSLRFPRGEIRLIPNWQILTAQVRVVPSGDIVTWKGQFKVSAKVPLSNIQGDLEEWVAKWGNAQAKIISVNDGLVDFEMTIPFIESSSEVFVSAAYDDLHKLFAKKNVEVTKLAIKN